MQVTQVTATYEATIPTQPYGNMKVGFTTTATVEAGENPEKVMALLQQQQRKMLIKAVLPVAKDRLASLQTLIAKLYPSEDAKTLAQRFGVLEWLRVIAPELSFAHVGEQSDQEILDRLAADATKDERSDYPDRGEQGEPA